MFNKELKKRSARILVVEDDSSTRLTISSFLKLNGYEPIVAENGKRAVELIGQHSPDIILMDAAMPEVDGFTATRTIRRQPGLERIPILMVTSHSDETYVDRAFEAGATEFISKPIHWAALRNRLNYLWQSIKQSEISNLATLVLDNTNEGVIITDAEMTILALNSAFTEITGYTKEDALGQTPRLLQSGRNDRAFYQAMWESLNTHGQWKGEIWNRRKNGVIYPEWLNISAVKNGSGQVTHYVGIFSDISLLKSREMRLQQLAHFDTLTGLANRTLFQERIAQAIDTAKENDGKIALLYIDLDNFKPVNDTYGHDTGDKVLQIIARRLLQTTRDNDTVSRLGGDEFSIILNDIKQTDNARIVAEKLINNTAQRISIDDKEVMPGCSIGVAIYPDHGGTPQGLLKMADDAMYRAKQAGKNQYRLYDE